MRSTLPHPSKNGQRAKRNLDSLFAELRLRGWEPGAVAGWDQASAEKNYGYLLRSRTKWKNLPIACVAVEYLSVHQPDTVRGNMYLVVSARWLPDTSKKSYNVIRRLLSRLRYREIIPWEWVTDNVRETIKPSSWSGLADYADTVADCYRKDFWTSLPVYVIVIVEKDTVAGKVQLVTEDFDVPLHPIRGYVSDSFAWEIVQNWKDIKKPIFIYYIGDHDPRGRDLERDCQAKLTKISKGRDFTWKRLAVNPEHFRQFKIIPLAPKAKDKCLAKFRERWGEKYAEVEAIPANDLRQMLREAIEGHIPARQWEQLQEVERREKEQWKKAMEKIGR
jgi:hypothetical protein